ncbi:MAG: S-layer homology domain-containing protein [Acidimicrobiia bacterium]|nr:S-layer homology domain-containing protein [Acidimicrobiia bacterium]
MATATLLVMALLAGVGAGTVDGLEPPAPVDTQPAAAAGALWLAAQVGPDGYVPAGEAPDVGATLDVGLSLAASGTAAPTFAAIIEWVRANPDVVAGSLDDSASPARLALAILLLNAAGVDPTGVGPDGDVDLVALLGSTFGGFEAGLYGAAAPTFDGAFRQSLAIMALHTVDATVPEAAVDWLLEQQCSGAPGAVGGWEAYRADTGPECQLPDPDTFSGPDTNQTALAAQALSLVLDPPAYELSLALDFLVEAQTLDGGFPYLTGQPAGDPNSTALVIGAIVAAGEDPRGGRWEIAEGVHPLTSLLDWQLGCDTDTPGAFASPFSGGAADLFASRQAVLGAALSGYAVAAPSFAPVSQVCPTTFDDVDLDHPFNGDISWLVANGIASGYADGTFRPTAPVSRQAAVAFLFRTSALWGGDVAEECDGEGPFSDVPADHVFCAEITWSAANGIAVGYADGTFRPTAPVSRQASAAFLARTSGLWNGTAPAQCDTEAQGPFSDVPSDHRFCPEITWLVDNGIASGYEDGTFRPTEPVSRQAMARFLSFTVVLHLPPVPPETF